LHFVHAGRIMTIMRYWLMKSEEAVYSIDDLRKEKGKTTCWEGVRNYQARNFMRDEMKKGDMAFFYHSNCDVPAIVGIVEIVREAYTDHYSWDPKSKYFDQKSSADKPRWFMVDVRFVKKFMRPVTLAEMKKNRELHSMKLLQKGNRLSVMPVTADQWREITKTA